MTDVAQEIQVAIVYTTYNDFDEEACKSCLNQSYSETRLYICDDSTEHFFLEKVDQFVTDFSPLVTLIRRPDHKGFKAGNLNNALYNVIFEELFLVCDADEYLPHDFVDRTLPYFKDPKVSFVQTTHSARIISESVFSSTLGTTISFFFTYWFPLRNKFGFVTSIGHGVVIRRNVWEAIGGFPEIVAEDLAFASRALANGFRGIFISEVRAEESFPETYKAFLTMNLKITSGTIEYFKREFRNILFSSSATYTEKIDIVLTFSSWFFGIVALLNLFTGILLSYVYKIEGNRELETWIYILYFISPFTPVIPMIINILRSPWKYFRYFLMASMAYGSAVPAIAIRTLQNIFNTKIPTFNVTGAAAREKQHLLEYRWSLSIGLFFLFLSLILRPPGYEASVCFSLIFILGPFLIYYERKDFLGYLSRISVYIPLIVFVSLLLFNKLFK